ncbi:MAG: sensor histidine kinase [Oscillospiraceae bacterium]|jgi:signal transduction histidine kinase|nr:sensor histidine kinase [Oscillospiraceae bacterium]MDD3260723.1 sensor histidine kinase [Oscillospiraceae bacterium]
MKLFFSYLQMHHKSLLFIGASALIFLMIFSLYDLPFTAVGYAAALSVCCGAVIGLLDFLNFRKKHFWLQKLQKQIMFGLDILPQPRTLVEKDYQELLQALFSYTADLTTEYDRSHCEMTDYYTLWAHQIKTPIAAMRILLQSDQGPDHDALCDCLFHIEEYVNMVLSYVRLNESGSDFVIKMCSLDAIVRGVIHKYAPLFIRKKVALHYQPISCTVLTDEKWLSFVIEQVLSNALKYTPSGSVSIYLEEPETLVIADTGIGIAPEDLPRIGQKGFTGYNGRMDKKSTGIGLYLCRRILKKLSHTFSISSEAGKGTAVRIGLQYSKIKME